MNAIEILTRLDLDIKIGEAKRYIIQGAVKINGKVCNLKDEVKLIEFNHLLLGKRSYIFENHDTTKNN